MEQGTKEHARGCPSPALPDIPGQGSSPGEEMRWAQQHSPALDPASLCRVCLSYVYPPCLVKDWERRKHISAKLFFFFFSKKCILSSLILLNSLVNGLLSGWETAHITQFTSSFWKSSPQSQHSIQKKYNRLCYNSPLCMAHRFGMQIP